MEILNSLPDIIKIAGLVITGLGIWYKDIIGQKLGMRKAVKDLESTAIDNVHKNLDLYQDMIDDIDNRYKVRLKEMEDAFMETIDRMKIEIDQLRVMNQELSTFVKEQKGIIQKQSRRIDQLKSKYNELD